jgi:hypothetical protein
MVINHLCGVINLNIPIETTDNINLELKSLIEVAYNELTQKKPKISLVMQKLTKMYEILKKEIEEYD